MFLKAADLKALPSIFYVGGDGLGLVIKEGSIMCQTQMLMWPRRCAITWSASMNTATGKPALGKPRGLV